MPVNLDGWILADGGNDQVVLSGEQWLPAGAYIILARARDPAQNGGVMAQIEYTRLQLANEEDELTLIAPNQR